MTTNNTTLSASAIVDVQQPERKFGFCSVRLSERDAWTGTTIAVLFNGLGMFLEMGIVRRTHGVSVEPAAVSVAVAMILLAVLIAWRNTPTLRSAYVIYTLNTISVATVLLLTNTTFAENDPNWSPFQASKLGCLVAAMLAPGFWVGTISVMTYCLSAFIQFQFFFSPQLKLTLDTAEPLPIFAFGLAGILALIYRFRRAQVEQELARIQAQNFAIKRLAGAFLNIRDLMNSPLQVIEFSTRLLRKSGEPQQPIIDRIDRSVQSLREINSVLVQHEKEIEWQAKR
jgi:hypothetical protein